MSNALPWAGVASTPLAAVLGVLVGRRTARETHELGEKQLGVAYIDSALAGLNAIADRLKDEVATARADLAAAKDTVGRLTQTLVDERAEHAEQLARISGELNDAYTALAQRDRELAEVHEHAAALQQQVNSALALLIRGQPMPRPTPSQGAAL
jgi:predicted  nucleic acid-binding Zn-ribbon protein